MSPWLLGIAAPLGVVLVIGAAALITRLTERRRSHQRATVCDMRTFHVAERQVAWQVARHDWEMAHLNAEVICTWLTSERHYGSARRQRKIKQALEVWNARRVEYRPEEHPASQRDA
ncbi:Putative membrane protein (plasmid) [Amycolatopsis japonica]|uniref:Putative membrane protein n=1 Tax=Amycolatopsis japonica TaxID=208439 RepID=A0A075V4I5_9PSEU|nr:hypothetical protein [Amycolatopsis japonica]AIG81287.1 Putative membrane protein [Amycolatopsis japonica]